MVTTPNFKSGKQLLKVFTSNKNLPEFIPKLPPSSLNKLIQEVGIYDATELIEFSTPDQFVAVVDESVWSSQHPGAPERFVPEEFLRWLEVILDVGDEFAAERLAAMDEDLLTTAMGYYVQVQDMNLRVVDGSDIRQEGQLDALEGMSKEASTLFDQFEVSPVFLDEWYVVEPALIALRSYQGPLFEAVLSRCCLAGSVLSSNRDSSHTELDAAHNREQRQESEGFVTPQRAGVFLAAARDTNLKSLVAMDCYDLDTQDYLNRSERKVAENSSSAPKQDDAEFEMEARFKDLNDAIELVEQQQLATQFISYDGPSQRTRLEDAIANLDPQTSGDRVKELAYLSNLIVKGERCDGERIKAEESAKLVMATCNLGHELFPQLEFDCEPGLVRLFKLGWHVLQQIPNQTLSALRELLDAKAKELDIARQWVFQEIASELNRPGLDADLEIRHFAAIHDSFDMLALVYDAETVAQLKLLVTDVPRWQQESAYSRSESAYSRSESAYSVSKKGPIVFLSSPDDLSQIATFIESLRVR